jgi:beta-lactamase regulating signal transducer with metallopeptidase domain
MIQLPLWLPLGAIRDLGWTLIHFLWQGLVLAALLYAILPMCRSAKARHNWALATLGIMALMPVLTFMIVHGQGGTASSAAVTETVFRGDQTAIGRLVPMSVPASWIDALVAFWLAGITVLSVRALGGWYLAEGLRRRDTIALPADLLARCRALKQRLKVTWPVQFLLSRRVTVPAVIGWLRPVVLIPISAVSGLAPQQLDALILHELAHIQRADAFINVAIIAVETILFYHPAVWWVSAHIRTEREHCCDDLAVSGCGDAVTYIEALTSLEVGRGVPAPALSASGGRLKDRVARLLGVPSNTRHFSQSAMAGLIFLSLVVGLAAAAQTNMRVSHQDFAIRIVDEAVGKDVLQGPAGDDRVRIAYPGKGEPKELWLKREGKIADDALADARVRFEQGKPVIDFRLSAKARDQFAAMTRDNVGRRLAVVVNDKVIIAPTVKSPILGGAGQLSGNFTTQAEANTLVAEMMGTNHPSKR